MALPADIVDDFTRISRYPLKEYFSEYLNFIDFHRLNILSYYSGTSSKPNEVSFNRLDKLLSKARKLNDVMDNVKNTFKNGAYWELYDLLGDMFTVLLTIDNSSKWLRSSITKNNFNSSVEVEHTIQQMQTLERIASDVSGSTNREQDWVSIALRNDLREEDYSPAGGNIIHISFKNRSTIRLNSVVDNITGERVYGIDLQRKIEFVSEDLVALTPRQTLEQSVDILATLIQGDTPEFPGEGIQKGIATGTNQNSISYPVLFRQYYDTFRKDDTLKALTVTKISRIEDALFIDLSVETRLGEIYETQSQL